MHKKQKPKLYLVPHTHWDREWYFSKITGDVLLNQLFNDILLQGSEAILMLDGQYSLIDDYLQANPDQTSKIAHLLQTQAISSGPFYTQPDVFNSLGETTLRNIELGQTLAKKWGAPTLTTAYLPDTFGFNQNLPQILRHQHINNFVFWRGPKIELLNKSHYFKWQGIDGSIVNAYNFKHGYYQLGQYYPYNQAERAAGGDDAKFKAGLIKMAQALNLPSHQTMLLPLGGDQAPLQHEIKAMIKRLELPYEVELHSNYEQFFATNHPDPITYQGPLRTPYTGKIHRTISSNRYDIKKSFRDAEHLLYYLLEPLELVYAQFDRNYNFARFKDHHILKPLLIAQAHDSLGGCNTDQTNRTALARTNHVQTAIMSQVDLIMKKLALVHNLVNDALIIFNPLPGKRNWMERTTIHATTPTLNITTDDLSIVTLGSQNIAFDDTKPLYKQDVIIYKANLEPLNYTVIDLQHQTSLPKNKSAPTWATINGSNITIKLGATSFNLHIKAAADHGDSYDFSPGPAITFSQKHRITTTQKLATGAWFVALETQLEINGTTTTCNWNLYGQINDHIVRTEMTIANQFKNTRLSLIIATDFTNVAKSQHMAITPFVADDKIANWSQVYHEYPAHVDHNDGLISLDHLYVMTQGTNEFYRSQNQIEIILYRSYSLVTRADMSWRPTTSGLSWKKPAPDANLIKPLHFDFAFMTNTTPQGALNWWNFKPYSYKVQTRNFIANKMSKFVINDILQPRHKLINLILPINQIALSSLSLKGSDIKVRAYNPTAQALNITMGTNRNTGMIKFSKYQLQTIIYKGEYDV